jgi:hypothetical protein
MRLCVNVRKQAVVLARVEILSDEDGDDERVNGNNTGHDDGNQTLRQASAMALIELEDSCTFIMRSGLNVPTPAMPMPDLAVP